MDSKYPDILVTYVWRGDIDSLHLPPDTDPMDIEYDTKEAIRRQTNGREPTITILAVRYPDGQLVSFD